MKWTQAKRLLGLASTRRATQAAAIRADESSPDSLRSGIGASPRAASLCVASGKGGTGKSVVSASLSYLFSLRGRTLILDADLGVGNAHILQDLTPTHSLVDVVEGRLEVGSVVQECGEQLHLLAAGSGVPRMAELNSYELHLIGSGLREVEANYRYLVVDSAAGVSTQTVGFAAASDVVLLVTTPDLTAMTDAYAFLKVLVARCPGARPLLAVNRAHDVEEAEHVAHRIQDVSNRFLGQRPTWIGWIPDDPAVVSCVNRRGSVAALEPESPAARALRALAVKLLEEFSRHHPRGVGLRLVGEMGYSSDIA